MWIIIALAALLAGIALFLAEKGLRKGPVRVAVPASLEVQPEATAYAAYAGSASCRDCHQEATQLWQGSHHGLAERPLEAALDRASFVPTRSIRHATQTSEARWHEGRYELVTAGLEGRKPFPLERVLGVSPLKQFLVPAPGGRFQVTELAVDPSRGDWFDVYGDEDRQPGEWGHWSGRGMNWNQMCAGCHNTRVRKNYAAGSDSYATAMVERAVGCEACHGPMASHVAWQKRHPGQKTGDPTVVRFTTNQTLHTCGSCHARRAEISDDFQPGQHFFDYYSLMIAGEGETYYSDGQVRDEDYEFTAFLGSRMAAAGVWCLDCHNPHSGKIRSQDDSLCLRCHGPPLGTAPKIDAPRHSFHPAGKPGSRCVDCHMPQTLYMARHWRRDHGYTIPDPLLTQQHGIPNACNRCHATNSVAWALAYTEQWYGARMNRHTRERAQWLARGLAGHREVTDQLIAMTRQEPIAMWRAVAVAVLRPWCGLTNVTPALVERLRDPDPLVRAKAARALEPFVSANDPAIPTALRPLLQDPIRSVRIEAAWTLRTILDTNTPAGRELAAYLAHNADQPAGLMQSGIFQMERGDPFSALRTFERAVSWDGHSAPLRHALAVALSTVGRHADAVRELETGVRLAPRDPELRFKLGLAYHEAGQLDQAVAALEQTVKLEPEYAQAWYNLGLAYHAQEKIEPALEALRRSEVLNPGSAGAAYAQATILARAGRVREAQSALRRVLAIQPSHPEARGLQQTLSLAPQ